MKTRKDFNKDSFKFVMKIVTGSKSGTLKCTKEELEDHFTETCSEPKRGKRLSYMKKLNMLTRPDISFNMLVLKARGVGRFINKARSENSPGKDEVSFKVYKKCPHLRYILFLLFWKKWKKRMLLTDGR